MSELHNRSLWHRRARAQLRAQPLCEWCLREGKVVAARVADHIKPHHNDPIEFWRGKLQFAVQSLSRVEEEALRAARI